MGAPDLDLVCTLAQKRHMGTADLDRLLVGARGYMDDALLCLIRCKLTQCIECILDAGVRTSAVGSNLYGSCLHRISLL